MFQCFGAELLRARHGSSTLFQCELGAKQGVHWVYPPAETVALELLPIILIPMVRHGVIRIDFGGDRRGKACSDGVYTYLSHP